MGGEACAACSWPSAGAAAPRVKPPANVAPLFRSCRRLKRFEPIGLSFADERKRKSLPRSRKYTRVSRPWLLRRDGGVHPAVLHHAVRRTEAEIVHMIGNVGPAVD